MLMQNIIFFIDLTIHVDICLCATLWDFYFKIFSSGTNEQSQPEVTIFSSSNFFLLVSLALIKSFVYIEYYLQIITCRNKGPAFSRQCNKIMTCLIIRLSHKRKYIENGYSTCTLSMIRIRNYRRRIYKQVSDNIIIRYATIYIHIESKYMLLLLNYFLMFVCLTNVLIVHLMNE